MKNVKLAQHALSALIFSSSVILSCSTAVFANEQLTASKTRIAGSTVSQGQVEPFGSKDVVQVTEVAPLATQSAVNINLASYAQLISLPGIGRVKATAIINYRKEVGMFSNLEDIQNIKGIGVKVFAKLHGKITI
jgi:competence protein ComEA